MLIHDMSDFDHQINQLLWNEKISQAQRWVENLAHGARVNHAPGIVEPLQTWQRWTVEPEFRVVVAFENISIVCACEIDQGNSPLETHRHTERKLIGGSHENNFWRRFFRRSVDHDSVLVNRLWN